jgi:hypothetical protein
MVRPGNILRVADTEAMIARAQEVPPGTIPAYQGGARGYLEGNGPEPATVVPTHIGGSRVREQELPPQSIGGNNFHGVRNIVSAKELDAVDLMYSTGINKTLPPGAHIRADGMIVLVASSGEQQLLTPQEYEEARHQAVARHQAQVARLNSPLVLGVLNAAQAKARGITQ